MSVTEICAAARDEFERRVAATELEVWPNNGGYLVRAWGNEGRDIAAALNDAGLPYEVTASGAYAVSSWPLQQAALTQPCP